MDFSYLIELAKANEEKSKTDKAIKFSTKVSNAKKLTKPGPSSNAVNQLLSKIEDERKKKHEEYDKKKRELLALRAKDSHSKKRVRCLINRTKGASKSVLEDAKDITTAKGESQCDEDDYGYESNMSQQIFSKLQNTYHEIPEDERLKFNKTTKSSIEDIKLRVMSSLKKKEEEELGIRKRRRKRKGKDDEEDDGFINDGDAYKKYPDNGEQSNGAKDEHREKKEKRPKSEKKVPANINLTNYKSDKYSQFKYDKEKHKEKGVDREKEKHKEKGVDREKERQKEKSREKEKQKEQEKGMDRENEKCKEERNKEKKKVHIKKNGPQPLSFEELMKMAQNKQKQPPPILDPIQEFEKKKEKPKEEERPLTAKEKKDLEEVRLSRLRKMGKLPPAKPVEHSSKNPPNGILAKLLDKKGNKVDKEKEKPQEKPVPEPPQKTKSKFFATTPKPSVNSVKSNDSKPTALKTKNNRPFSPPKLQKMAPQTKKPSVPAAHFPTKSSARGPPQPCNKRRIDSDDEDEYDSEMDDFIDDGDVEMDYSSEIAKMFGYDKSKYKNIDEDVDDMEASYSQVEKEEKISARAGLLEDLEDIRREEEEKKRKKKMRK